MSTVINTNMFSIHAQRQASYAQRAEQVAMERLSTGERINHSRDDAVGLAALHHQNAQINGYTQSIRNTNDGISLLQVADGAMGTITDVLQRMRELTLQSVSGTLSGVDRGYLQKEFESLQDEIVSTVQATEFNDVSILNRSQDQEKKSFELQVGGEFSSLVDKNSFKGEEVDVNLRGYYSAVPRIDSGSSNEITVPPISGFPSIGTVLYMEVDGVEVDPVDPIILEPATRTADQWADEIEQQINSNAGFMAAGKSVSVSYDQGYNRFTVLSNAVGEESTVKVTATSGAGSLGFPISSDMESGQAKILSTMGVPQEDRLLTIDIDGYPLQSVSLPEIEQTIGGWSSTLIRGVEGLKVGFDDETNSFILSSLTGEQGTISLMGSATALGLRVHETNQITMDHYDLDDPDHALGALLLDTQSIATEADASAMLAKIDAAVSYVNEGRSHFAAVENHLERVSENLEQGRVVSSKARSTIRDTDFAAESAEMAKNQILKQVTTAMMAQANQVPKQMLQLFK